MKPVNRHLLIEPLKHDSFLSSAKETYEEIGVVLDFAEGINWVGDSVKPVINKGDKVFFDSWCAAKYPDGKDGFLWLVKWDDIRAISNE